MAVVLARLRCGQQPLELTLPETAREATGDENCLPLVRHAELGEVAEYGRERLLSRVDLCSRDRERRRLHHDRRTSTRERRTRQWLASERKAERVPNRPRDVDDGRGRRRWSEDHVLVADRDVDDP
jgi:hypothetical protein